MENFFADTDIVAIGQCRLIISTSHHISRAWILKLECTITQFLRGGVQNLPAIVSFLQIISPHPGLNPAMEVPKVRRGEKEIMSYIRWWNVPLFLIKWLDLKSVCLYEVPTSYCLFCHFLHSSPVFHSAESLKRGFRRHHGLTWSWWWGVLGFPDSAALWPQHASD